MPKASPLLFSFNAGEFAPRLDARVDISTYANSCRSCENFIPLTLGPATKRSGTRFVNEAEDSSKTSRLIPFEFSVTQAYILEFADENMRVYRDEGVVTASRTITNAADNGAGLIRITAVGHDYATGTITTIAGVVGTTEANATWTITVIDADNFDLQGSAFVNPYTSGGTASFDGIETPYDHLELVDVKYIQTADTMYLVHPDYAPRVLTRTGHTNWSLTTLTAIDGPYASLNTTAITLTPSAVSGAITLTASAALFVATDVGRQVRLLTGGSWGYATITGFTSTTVVNATVNENFGGVGASANWRLGAWSDTTGYPSAVAFSDNRLVFGGMASYPQQIDMSRPDEYDSFKPTAAGGTVADDNAISVTLAANDVNAIEWLLDNDRGLFVGTAGGEWLLSTSDNGAFTPSNTRAVRSSVSGCSNTNAIRAGSSVLFVQRAQRKILELIFSFERDSYLNVDLTQLADHITEGGITEVAFQKEPNTIIWITRDDGELLGLTFKKEENVVAWHRHIIGGFSDSGGTIAAKVESVAVIPAPDGTHDQLWMVVQRYINGGVVRYVEFFEEVNDDEKDQEDLFYVDSGLTYDSTPTSTISGLAHLEGETVSLLVDGAVHPDRTVSSGAITLDASYSVVHVGFQYTAKIQKNRIEAGAGDGTSLGKTRRINKLNILLHKSLGGKYGPNETDTQEFDFRTPEDAMDTPPPLFTGFVEINWDGGYDKNGYITVVHDQPLPMTILGLMPTQHVFDR